MCVCVCGVGIVCGCSYVYVCAYMCIHVVQEYFHHVHVHVHLYTEENKTITSKRAVSDPLILFTSGTVNLLHHSLVICSCLTHTIT